MTPAAPSNLFGALAALGAGDFEHRNGTLDRHLLSVHDLLLSWGAGETLRRAGLFHAAYGTAGFTLAMVSPGRRFDVAAIIGLDAERVVYRYCSCDREAVWPQIGGVAPVRFRDRFTGDADGIDEGELRAFCELTCANEVEIARGDAAFAERAGDYLGGLFRGWGALLSRPARQAVEAVFPAR